MTTIAPTIAQALREAATRLASVTDTARLDAELLMAHQLRVSRSDMLLFHAREPVEAHVAGFEQMLARRLAHEPVAYILGQQDFFGHIFQVAPGVLIPRADSETTVQAALDAAKSDARVLDCGVGSGALLLSFLAERPEADGIGIDASATAAEIAAANCEALGLSGRAQIRQGDWTTPGWADQLGQFDLVLSNPPYVETSAALDRGVMDWEPHEALFAGEDGLDDYAILVPQLRGLLAPDGVAVLEIGWQQADAVAAIAKQSGFAWQLYRDLADRPRALVLH